MFLSVSKSASNIYILPYAISGHLMLSQDLNQMVIDWVFYEIFYLFCDIVIE